MTFAQNRVIAGAEQSDKLDRLLLELLPETPEHMLQRVNTLYDRLADPFQNRCVIFGAGQLGRFVLPGLRAAGIEPLAYCDNSQQLWGTNVEDIPVLPPSAAVERFRDEAVFLVAVYNGTPIRRQLLEMGCPRVVPYVALFWKHWKALADERLDLPQHILKETNGIRAAYDLLSDEKSRDEFLAQIRWRCLLDYSCLPSPHAPVGMYFPRELFSIHRNEVFVDCGAYDGDTVRTFLERVGGDFRRIYAIEPDAANRRALASYIGTLSTEIASRITVLHYALGQTDGELRFAANGNVGSKFDFSGTVDVECRRLDSIFSGECPTLIKMDIEGAEVEAIPGAARIARQCRPVFAVCAYHRCEHLWTLPKLLKAANPDYRLYLRRYAEECWETVYYAVPPERISGEKANGVEATYNSTP